METADALTSDMISTALPNGLRSRLMHHVDTCKNKRQETEQLRRALPRVSVVGLCQSELIPCCELEVVWRSSENEDLSLKRVQDMCNEVKENDLLVVAVTARFNERQLKSISDRCRGLFICAAVNRSGDRVTAPQTNCEEPWIWCSESGLGSLLSSWCWAQPEYLLHALSLSLRIPDLLKSQVRSTSGSLECSVCQKMLQQFGEESDAYAQLSTHRHTQGEVSKRMLTKLLQEEIMSVSRKIPFQRRSITQNEETDRPRGLMFGYNVTRGRGINKTNESEQRLLKLIHALAMLRDVCEPYAGAQVTMLCAGQSVAAHIDNTESDSWSIAFGEYTGGTLQINPASNPTEWQDVNNHMKWRRIKRGIRHQVTEVTSGVRISVVIYIRKGVWKNLGRKEKETLWRQGFPVYDVEGSSEDSKACKVETKQDIIETSLKEMHSLSRPEALQLDLDSAAAQLQRMCDGTHALQSKPVPRVSEGLSERGMFVVLEGSDCAPVKEHVRRMKEWFESQNMHCSEHSTPNPGNCVGRVILAHLQNRIKVSPRLLSVLWIADQWMSADQVMSELHSGRHVLGSRYVYSSLAYGSLSNLSQEVLRSLIEGLPKPDVTFMLGCEPHGRYHEQELKIQVKLQKAFLDLAKSNMCRVVEIPEQSQADIQMQQMQDECLRCLDSDQSADVPLFEGPVVPEKAYPTEEEVQLRDAHPFPATTQHGLEVLVRQAHEKMGHPSKEQFLRIIRSAGATDRVLNIARSLECSICQQMVVPSSQRRGAVVPCVGFNQMVGADLFFLTGPSPDEKTIVLSMICWGTLYQTCTIIKSKSAKDVRRAYVDSWLKHFGPPRRLITDQGTEFTAAEFTERVENDGTQHELTAVDTPWQNGRTERAGGIIKMMVSKIRMSTPPQNSHELQEIIIAACTAKNRYTLVGGHAPYQRVFGTQMRLPGRNLGDELEDADLGVMSALEAGDTQVQRSTRLRALAREAFNHIDATDRIRRCILSGPRPLKQFVPGDLVFMWKRSGDAQAFRIEHRHSHWHGPCTVIGHHRSKIWVNFRGHLWLCSPEQVRPATLEETAAQQHVGEELQRLSEELNAPGARYYTLPEDEAVGLPEPSTSAREGRPMDVQVPEHSEEEETTEVNREREEKPERGRSQVRGRSPGPQDLESSRYRSRSRGRSMWCQEKVFTCLVDGSQESDADLGGIDLQCANNSPYACVLVSVPQGQDEAKKRKEISFLHLKKPDQERFKGAMQTEWENILQPHSAKLLSLEDSVRIRETPELRERIVPTRWVLVEKDMGVGEATKAKARLVLQGFRDPDLHDLEVASPTLSKDSLPVVLQVIASFKWTMLIADIKGAFMKSRPLNRKQGPLYAAMPSLGTLPLAADRVQLIEIRCAWYGLNDGPKEFYESFHSEVSKLGCRRSKLDPCVYSWFCNGVCEGVFGVTVDDMVCGGTQRFRKQVLDRLNQRFPFGKLCERKGRFTGRDLEQDENGNISISQVEYVKGLEPIPVPRTRRRDKKAVLSPLELTALRGKVGELNWLQGVSRPDLSGSVSMLQGSFSNPTVGNLLECNKILKEAQEHPVVLSVRSIPLERLRFNCSADAAWANAADQASQMGFIIFASDNTLEKGFEAPFSVISWKSHKQRRKASSTLGAETIAASEGLSALDWTRTLFEECVKESFLLSQWEQMIAPRPATLLTDCKSVYDALNQLWCSNAKTDKRLSIDLAIIRECLARDSSKVRWIETHQQLADSMTKNSVSPLFLRQTLANHRYRIMEETDALLLKGQNKNPSASK
eukprot:2893124-Amphidinium_carterae.2